MSTEKWLGIPDLMFRLRRYQRRDYALSKRLTRHTKVNLVQVGQGQTKIAVEGVNLDFLVSYYLEGIINQPDDHMVVKGSSSHDDV